MTAQISYQMMYIPNPWSIKNRSEIEHAWCLVMVTTPEFGGRTEKPIALFNLTSEAVTFQGHLIAAGLDNTLVIPDKDTRELLLLRKGWKR